MQAQDVKTADDARKLIQERDIKFVKIGVFDVPDQAELELRIPVVAVAELNMILRQVAVVPAEKV